MAKKANMPPTAAGDEVVINLVDNYTFTTADFDVSGTAKPTDASVSGILTDTASGATIQSNPATVTCTPSLPNWTLHFESVPPGSYILSVNEVAGHDGADAKNITVASAIALNIDSVSPGPTSATATVSYAGPGTVTVSAVISMSPPHHGTPKKKDITSTTTATFTFNSLPRNTNFTITAIPISGFATGASKKSKTT